MFIVHMINTLQGFKVDSSIGYVNHLRALIEASAFPLQFAWLSTKVGVDNTSTVISHLTAEEIVV